MKNFIIFIALFLALTTQAKDSLVKVQYGVAFNADKILDSSAKSINVGYYTKLRSAVSFNVHAGYLGDDKADLNAGYACAQFGASLNPWAWAFVENYFGPCYITKTADKLSGPLQFATHIGAGYRDPITKNEIGLNWKHLSNAGLKKPNIGRDLIMLSLGFGI